MVLATAVASAACSSDALTPAPPTTVPAGPAQSPAVVTEPVGLVHPLPGGAQNSLFDAATSSLLLLNPAAEPASVTVMGAAGQRTVPLPGPATALAGDENGTVYASTRGGYFDIDLATNAVTAVTVGDRRETDFTAIARRADGRLVLGTSDGAVVTLGPESDATASVAAEVHGFVRVDALVAVGETAVVLDRAQSSVTALDGNGETIQQALRAGIGATTLATDDAGRALVADTRGGELMVFGTDPLIMRQRYPVPDAPYGLVGGAGLVWVSQTAANMVVGYDLATGIPVEKVRYPTVQQPNSLAFDDATSTLYVVSASGDGVQVIDHAGGPR